MTFVMYLQVGTKPVKLMIKSFLSGGGGHPRERVKDLVMEDHLECGCVGSVRLKGDNLLEDKHNNGSRRQFFDFFLGSGLL